jgi:hypothetical protein
MKNHCKLRILSGCLIASVVAVTAEPVERKAIMESPAWVFHVDLDGLRQSQIGQHILSEMQKPKAEEKFAGAKEFLGFDPRTALHGLTVYGTSPSPENGVALVYADFDSARLVALAEKAEDHRVTAHGDHKIHSWIDEKKQKKEGGNPRTYASIYKDRLVIFAQKQARLADALDVLEGNKPSLAGSDEFKRIGAGADGTIVQAVAWNVEVPDSNPSAAVFKQSKRIVLKVEETEDRLLGTLTLEADNEDSARRVADIARGLIALVGLQQDNHAVAKLARGLSVDRQGTDTMVELKLPVGEVIQFLKTRAAEKAAAKAEAEAEAETEPSP